MAESTNSANVSSSSIQEISVIVPRNPFIKGDLGNVSRVLAAFDVEKLMNWWPGAPHSPHPDPKKLGDIQRSLDWKRVAQIAAYLLQAEIGDAPDKLAKYFDAIYGSIGGERGREWPPKTPKIAKFQRSVYPTFSNILLHINGATLTEEKAPVTPELQKRVRTLVFDEQSSKFSLTVIDGQHRINGAYFALCLMREAEKKAEWDIPAEIFLDLDEFGRPPRHQAQIFIDVNFNQKKVDRSLVADLFPSARGGRDPLDDKERAQDLGRKLMLEIGPLVGMVQIPGIKFGVKDVVTLATLNSAIEDVIPKLNAAGIESLEAQAEFLALCLDAWLEASGRKEDVTDTDSLKPENVAYQGRVIVSCLTLVPACLFELKRGGVSWTSSKARTLLERWFLDTMKRARLIRNGRFLARGDFRAKGFLGSGGLARFRDTLWIAATSKRTIPSKLSPDELSKLASSRRGDIGNQLGVGHGD
jgi:DGQHR domain-containing protein